MKKIQISSVKLACDAQVVVLNSHLCVRATKAYIAAESALKKAATPVTENVPDETGKIVEKPVKDENGKQKYDYRSIRLNNDDIAALHEMVLPFLKDLADALEEGE